MGTGWSKQVLIALGLLEDFGDRAGFLLVECTKRALLIDQCHDMCLLDFGMAALGGQLFLLALLVALQCIDLLLQLLQLLFNLADVLLTGWKLLDI